MSHADDQDLWLLRDAGQSVLESLGRAEKECTVDLVDFDSFRNPAWLLDVFVRILELARYRADVRHFGHAPDEEEGSKHHPDFDRNCEIDQHRQKERCKKYDDITAW